MTFERVLPIDPELLKRAAWQPTAKRPLVRLSLEEQLRRHRKKRARIVRRRRRKAWRARWMSRVP